MSSFSKQRHNPWCDDHVVSGNLNNILLTAEKAGLLRLDDFDKSHQEEVLKDAEKSSKLLSTISLLKDITETKKQLHEKKKEMQRCLGERRTMDITDCDVTDGRLQMLRKLNYQLDQLTQQKTVIITCLQQPHATDLLAVESIHRRYVSEVMPMMVPVLSLLSTHLHNITHKPDFSDTQLDSLLTSVVEKITALDLQFKSMAKMRQKLDMLGHALHGTTTTSTPKKRT